MKKFVILVLLLVSTLWAQQPMTVSQGVYTQAQAVRGQALYKAQCATCHGDALQGRNGPPLAGDDFTADWNKGPLSELFNKIAKTMPENAPGKLTGTQTADILAYILQTGKFPAGSAELGASEAALKQISWPAGSAARPVQTAAGTATVFPPAGNLAQVMRGILFPSSNIIFTVQTHDPAEKKKAPDAGADGGFDWAIWGANLYPGWDLVDYAAVALSESAQLMLTPGRRCENGKPVPVNDPDWIKFTNELNEAGRTAYKASQTRNQETVSDVSNVVADACLHCHQVYRDRRGGGLNLDRNNAGRCTSQVK